MWPIFIACATSGGTQGTLRLEGPDNVVVDRVGPVPAPRAIVANGVVPDGIIYSLSTDGVARVERDQIIAVGPGAVEVTAEWEGQRLVWTLEVALDTVVAFVAPRLTLRVGQRATYEVAVSPARQRQPAEPVRFSSSNVGVLTVDDDGTVTARVVGVAYLTAVSAGASAMIEIEVLP